MDGQRAKMSDKLEKAIRSATTQLGFQELKPQQYDAVFHFMQGKDVFAALPTGFGKSVIFGILPTAFDIYLERPCTSIAVVITPLVALMKEFKEKFVPRGISAEFVGELQTDAEATQRIVLGRHQLVFCSPENLFENPALTNMLTSQIYQERMVALVVDEAHCIDKW
jgi:bloom syndrome protein